MGEGSMAPPLPGPHRAANDCQWTPGTLLSVMRDPQSLPSPGPATSTGARPHKWLQDNYHWMLVMLSSVARCRMACPVTLVHHVTAVQSGWVSCGVVTHALGYQGTLAPQCDPLHLHLKARHYKLFKVPKLPWCTSTCVSDPPECRATSGLPELAIWLFRRDLHCCLCLFNVYNGQLLE